MDPEGLASKLANWIKEQVDAAGCRGVVLGMSGGLDSSGITTLVVKNFDSDVRTFGIRFEEDSFDEGDYQRQMVSYLKVNHSDVRATNEDIGASLANCYGTARNRF